MFGNGSETILSIKWPGQNTALGWPVMRKIFFDNRGATAIEYGLIAALIAVAAIAAMQGLGSQLSTTFSNVSTNMKAS
jgi:pilus assembly protein Flp/PilA